MLKPKLLPTAFENGDYFFDDSGEVWVVKKGSWVMTELPDLTWCLFIDDEREFRRVYRDEPVVAEAVVTVRSYTAAEKFIGEAISRYSTAFLETVCFDHDLGTPETGVSLMHLLISAHLDKVLSLNTTDIFIHTANPVGRRNLAELWTSFCTAHSITPAIQHVKAE